MRSLQRRLTRARNRANRLLAAVRRKEALEAVEKLIKVCEEADELFETHVAPDSWRLWHNAAADGRKAREFLRLGREDSVIRVCRV